MKNTKDYKRAGEEKILLIGGPGSGKTTQFLTLPGKKFLYIFDPNCLPSLEGADIDYEMFCPEIDDLDLSLKTLKRDKKTGVPKGDKPQRAGKKRPEPQTYLNWEEHFEKHMDSGFFDQYDAIGFDSFTMFTDIAMDRILYINNRLGGNPEMGDYAILTNAMVNVFRVFNSQDALIFCTGHYEWQVDEVTKKTRGKLIAPGRMRTRMPLIFSNIWGCICESDAENESFVIQTRPDREFPFVRSAVKGLDMIEDVTILDFKHPERYGIGALIKGKVPETKSTTKKGK